LISDGRVGRLEAKKTSIIDTIATVIKANEDAARIIIN
jgi:hypothetical protein